MAIGVIIALVLLPFAIMFSVAVNKLHKDETGFNMPSRNAMRGFAATLDLKALANR